MLRIHFRGRSAVPLMSESNIRGGWFLTAGISLLFGGCQHPRATPLPPTLLRCESSEPVVIGGEATGFEVCSNGMTHRSSSKKCPSLLPRRNGGADELIGIFPDLYKPDSTTRGEPAFMTVIVLPNLTAFASSIGLQLPRSACMDA